MHLASPCGCTPLTDPSLDISVHRWLVTDDIFHGNPDGDADTMIDPGYRQPVRKLSYTGVSMTRNNRELTPDGSYSVPLRSCSRSSAVVDVTTESKYAFSLSRDIIKGKGLGKGTFNLGDGDSFRSSLSYRKQVATARKDTLAVLQAKSCACLVASNAGRTCVHCLPHLDDSCAVVFASLLTDCSKYKGRSPPAPPCKRASPN